ncbi:LacI family DNA-binding transcriptional regulator [Listeria seeligeri]|uniref:LacI family transcriptional regulator n=1 Tax=Listeria seeligeri TaxID=1640 RepID=A0A7T0Q8D2_LISSE|nr:LacI family DNA-binding transcriptional regulator [Listeria seeligeri]EAE1273832.1 LacI family transcriptional regulator [Listeria monocytogenes]QPJ28034.1 LacI family DNA-binding transcriptional regulator [Listeria seeligeri]QPL19380.1 lacI family transcriptional regulator [Listeria seeligeri]
MKKISIKEIAHLSGVSVATVSRVINDNGRFSEETRKRVLEVIKETGYQMNYSAKSLRMNRSFSVGILVPDISNYFFSDVVQKIEEILFDKGYSTIICNTARNTDKEIAYLQMLESKIVDGLVIISGAEKFDSEKAHLNRATPYICIDREPIQHSDTVFISSNHYQGAFEATEELFKSGSKSPIIVHYDRESTSSTERKKGFRDALRKNNIIFNEQQHELVFNKEEITITKLLKQAFSINPEIDAIFAINDNIALDLLEILPTLKKPIPSKVKVIGFDNTPMARYCYPKLSSVKQNTKKIAEITVDTLIDKIEHPGKEIPPLNLVPVELVIRDSTKN